MDMTLSFLAARASTDAPVHSRFPPSSELPPEFPERYRSAVIRSAEQCSVKTHLEHPPDVAIEAVMLTAT